MGKPLVLEQLGKTSRNWSNITVRQHPVAEAWTVLELHAPDAIFGVDTSQVKSTEELSSGKTYRSTYSYIRMMVEWEVSGCVLVHRRPLTFIGEAFRSRMSCARSAWRH